MIYVDLKRMLVICKTYNKGTEKKSGPNKKLVIFL